MRRSLKTIIVILMMSFVLISGTTAKAIGPLPLFIGLQALNDLRQQPIAVETPGINPQYSVYSGGSRTNHGDFVNGKFEGVCIDPRTQVAASARGTTQVWDFGIMASQDVGGVEIISSSSFFPKKVGVYEEGYAKKFAKQVFFQTATDKLISAEDARFGKWQVSFNTSNLPTGAYQVTVQVWNKQGKPVFFGLDRKSIAKKTPVLCRFLILNAQEIGEAANDLQVQKDLAVTYGLIAGPPQFSQRQILVSPELIAGLQREGLLPPQPGTNPAPPSESAQSERSTSAVKLEGQVEVSSKTESITIVIWNGDDHQIWNNQNIDTSQYSTSRFVQFTRNGQVVTMAECSPYKERNKILEMRIYRGGFPTTGDEIDFAKEN